MKDPSIFNPKLPEPKFSDPQYEPEFGPELSKLELSERLNDKSSFLFIREFGEPRMTTVVVEAPAKLVYYFVHLISQEARTSRRFDVSEFDEEAVRLAVAWMKAGGLQSLESLMKELPFETLVRLSRHVLDFCNKLRIIELSWRAAELLDGINKGQGGPDRAFRDKLSRGLEARYMHNKAGYNNRMNERDRDARKEIATEAGFWGCLGGCLAVFEVCCN